MRRRYWKHASWLGIAFLIVAVVRILIGSGVLWHLGVLR